MTEAAFQEARKIMQQANWRRGAITKCKASVAKWTKLEDAAGRAGQMERADGCRKLIEKAMERLSEARKKFADLKFPDPDLKEEVTRCGECGSKIAQGNEYCGECLCEDDM